MRGAFPAPEPGALTLILSQGTQAWGEPAKGGLLRAVDALAAVEGSVPNDPRCHLQSVTWRHMIM